MGAMRDKIMGNDWWRKDTFNWVSKDGTITVDTCEGFDTHKWETGIKRTKIEGKWAIVEQYKSREDAVKGHQEWIKKIETNPKQELEDINLWGL